MYTPTTYQCLHHHEGLFNSLHRRFSNKHPTKQQQKSRVAKKKNKIEIRLNLIEFFDLLEITNTVYFTIGDRRQPTRQEITWIFRCASGPLLNSIASCRGLNLPQFLDALARLALLLAFRARDEVEDAYPLIGIYKNGGAIPTALGTALGDEQGFSSDEEVEAETKAESENQQEMKEQEDADYKERSTWSTAVDRGKSFSETVNVSHAIEKYICKSFENFVAHG